MSSDAPISIHFVGQKEDIQLIKSHHKTVEIDVCRC